MNCRPGRDHAWTYEGESRMYRCRICGYDPEQEEPMMAETLTPEGAIGIYKTGEAMRDTLRQLRTNDPEVWRSMLRTDSGLALILLTEHLEAAITREQAGL